MVRITRRRMLALGGGLAAGAVGYAWRIEPVWLRRVEVEVALPRLDPAFDGYRIAQLSDLHVGAGVPRDYLLGAVAEANACRPDLVALTGDFVHRGAPPANAGVAGEILSGLRARDGLLGVLGNHDAQVFRRGEAGDRGSMRRVIGALREAGVRTLENERATIERGGAKLRVAGLGDLWSGYFDPSAVDLRDAVVLSHNPDSAPRLARHGPALILSGHTHGGQVSIPFLGPPILPVEHREYSAGLYSVRDSRLYVNRGVGWLRRVRLFVRPEVTLLTLKARA